MEDTKLVYIVMVQCTSQNGGTVVIRTTFKERMVSTILALPIIYRDIRDIS